MTLGFGYPCPADRQRGGRTSRHARGTPEFPPRGERCDVRPRSWHVVVSEAAAESGGQSLRPAPGSKKSSFRGRCVMFLGPLRAHRSPPDLGRRVRSEAAVPLRQKTSGPAETRQSRTDLRRCGSVFKRGPAVGPHTAAGTHFFREAGDAFSRTFLSYWLWWESNPCPRSPKQGPPSRRLGTAIIAKREGGSGVRVQPERRPTGPPRSTLPPGSAGAGALDYPRWSTAAAHSGNCDGFREGFRHAPPS